MSDRRVTVAHLMYEYGDPDDDRRVTAVHVMYEYSGETRYRRVSQAVLMVEYRKPWDADLNLVAQTIP